MVLRFARVELRYNTRSPSRGDYYVNRSFNVKAYTASIPVSVSTSNFVTRDVELAIFDRIVKFGFINCKDIDWIFGCTYMYI